MGKGTNGYERIQQLMALMMAEKYTTEDDLEPVLTLRELSEITGFPLTLVQRDMTQLLDNNTVKESLMFAEADNIEKDEWINDLRSGKESVCDVKFCLLKDYFWDFDEGEASPVDLSPFEKNVFAKVVHRSGVSDAVWVKDTWKEDNSRLEKLSNALRGIIERGNRITFTYDYRGVETVCKDYSPVSIYETTENRQLYLVGYDEEEKADVKRLDCISELKEQKEKAVQRGPEGLEFLEYIWEADASLDERVDVKIKIFNNTKNIIPKIKVVADGRKHAKLYPEEGNDAVWYYEDTVCGMNSFRRWLRSFGASVVVLEPLRLAEEMYQSAVRRLEKYEYVIVKEN